MRKSKRHEELRVYMHSLLFDMMDAMHNHGYFDDDDYEIVEQAYMSFEKLRESFLAKEGKLEEELDGHYDSFLSKAVETVVEFLVDLKDMLAQRDFTEIEIREPKDEPESQYLS